MTDAPKNLANHVKQLAADNKTVRQIVAAIIINGHMTRTSLFSSSNENKQTVKEWVDWVMGEI